MKVPDEQLVIDKYMQAETLTEQDINDILMHENLVKYYENPDRQPDIWACLHAQMSGYRRRFTRERWKGMNLYHG